MKNILIILLIFVLGAGFTIKQNGHVKFKKGPRKVELVQKKGKYRLYVDGKEFYIKGAGCEFGDIEKLAQHGANSFRTWRTENGQKSGQEILDLAQKNGLLVLMGLEIKRERHGFEYNNADSVKAQLEYIKGEVMKYRNHPALLAWGIGNELNLGASNMKVWDAVNEIAKMIHKIDPNHPTTTMLCGIGKKEIDYIKANCPDIDFICVQMYADIENLQKRIADSGYDGPYLVTEWGATGHWEVKPTEWSAPVEQTSHEKQNSFFKRYNLAIASDQNRCMGSYAFLWGQKQERTPTWYGMFLESGEETEIVDAMHKIWTGNWPENRCPVLDSMSINGEKIYDNVYLQPTEKFEALVAAHDFENDSLTYRWEILPESTDLKWGGDKENRPETLLHQVGDSKMALKAPQTEGAYRLFVYVTDGHNHAATANFPFYVKKKVMTSYLKNSKLEVQFGNPGELYTGSRFDHSGNIMQIVLNKHHTFCSTEKKEYSSLYGFGLVNEFDIDNPSGYAETKPGEKFQKIGVGAVAKADNQPYKFAFNYSIDPLVFEVTQIGETRVQFSAKSQLVGGIQIYYKKELSISENVLTIDYYLKNIGEKSIETEEYCHNFLAIDHLDIGSDYRLEFDFELNPEKFSFLLNPDNLMTFDGNGISWKNKPESDFFISKVSGDTQNQFSWKLINSKAKAGVSEKTDFICSKVNLWGTGHVVSPELFHTINLLPGEEVKWKRVYTFFEM